MSNIFTVRKHNLWNAKNPHRNTSGGTAQPLVVQNESTWVFIRNVSEIESVLVLNFTIID